MKLTPESLNNSLNKKFGEGASRLLGVGDHKSAEALSTGMAVLDNWIIGVGGVPTGKIIEIYGDSSAGKSSIVNKMMAAFQKQGGIAAYCDFENSYDPNWATVHGVDTEALVLPDADHLDGDGGLLAYIEAMAEKATETPVLIVVDSLAAVPTKKEFTEGISGGAAIAEGARCWSNGLRVLCKKLAGSKATLILINQQRTKIGVLYGDPTTTPGGNAPKFYSSVRLHVSHGKMTPDGLGKFVKIKATKNKCAYPFRSGEFKLQFETGFNEKWSIMNHAKAVGVVSNKSRKISEALEGLHWTDKTLQGITTETEEDEDTDVEETS